MQTQSKTINVNYEVKKDGKSERRHFKLPVSKERYIELANGLTPDSKAWYEVRGALTTLARLQNGELGSWGVELLIETEDD